MSWQYNAVRDDLTVTYGSQDRKADKSFATEDSVLEVDRHGDPLRVIVRRASKYCPIEQLLSLDSTSLDGERRYSIAEVADQLGVKPYTVRQEVLDGGMPAVKTATSWDVRECVVELYREVLAIRQQSSIIRSNMTPGDREAV